MIVMSSLIRDCRGGLQPCLAISKNIVGALTWQSELYDPDRAVCINLSGDLILLLAILGDFFC